MKPGTTVIYVPRHIRIENMDVFDFNTPGCEYGFIKSSNDTYVFVNYVKNGIPQETANATDPNDLFLLNGRPLLNASEVFKKICDENDC